MEELVRRVGVVGGVFGITDVVELPCHQEAGVCWGRVAWARGARAGGGDEERAGGGEG